MVWHDTWKIDLKFSSTLIISILPLLLAAKLCSRKMIGDY